MTKLRMVATLLLLSFYAFMAGGRTNVPYLYAYVEIYPYTISRKKNRKMSAIWVDSISDIPLLSKTMERSISFLVTGG
jgi:hypothetical protein